MDTSLKHPVRLFLFLFLAQISWSKGTSTECSKLIEPLCEAIKTKSNDDTIYVNFILRQVYAPKPDSCKSIDLKAHPDTNCVDRADANYWNRLIQGNREIYASYSSMMMSVVPPSATLAYQGDSNTLIVGAVVTKMNLLVIVQDTNLTGAEPFFYSYPIIVAPRINARSNNSSGNGSDYSVNGQLIQSADRVKSFKVKIRK